MIYPGNLGGPFRSESRENQGSTRSQVRCHDLSSAQLFHTRHDRAVLVHLDIRTHSLELTDVNIPILKNRL